MSSTERKRATRQYLLDTYGDGRICPCWLCEVPLTLGEITVDRVIPGSQGGTYKRSNCRPACYRCNNDRGSRTGAALEAFAELAKLRRQLEVPPRGTEQEEAS